MRQLYFVLLFIIYYSANVISREVSQDIVAKIWRNPFEDPFEEIPNKEIYMHEQHVSMEEHVNNLAKPFEELVQIEVRLVGFTTYDINEKKLTEYLSSSNQFDLVQAIHLKHPVGEADDDDFDIEYEDAIDGWNGNALVGVGGRADVEGATHRCGVERRFIFKSSKVKNNDLHLQLKRAIDDKLDNGIYQISYSAVDNVIAADYAKYNKTADYVIYVLSLTDRSEAYQYSEEESAEWNGCGGSIGIGTGAGSGPSAGRWLWIDLSAGPINIGPRTSGEGAVSTANLPHIKIYNSQGQNTEQTKNQLALDIASFVHKASEFVISPSIDHLPLLNTGSPYFIHLVVIHDHPVGEKEKYKDFNFATIEQQLADVHRFKGQNFIFRRTDVSIFTNHFAAISYANSLKSHTSIIMNAEKHPTPVVHEYLDSHELHYWLKKFSNMLMKGVGDDTALRSWTVQMSLKMMHDDDDELEEFHNILPIFLFDFSYTDITLLDRYDQVKSFPDMVIGVQIDSSHMKYDFKCNGESVFVDPRDCTRPLLGAIIQSAFGVCPSNLKWNEENGRAMVEYLFSSGRTPFGVFSKSVSLSFSQRDAIAQNQIYRAINETRSRLIHAATFFSQYDVELFEAIDPESYENWVIRWNLYLLKMKRAMTELSLRNYQGAFDLISNVKFDIDAMMAIEAKGVENIRVTLNCRKKGTVVEDPIRIFQLLAPISTFFVLAVLFIYLIKTQFKKFMGSTVKSKAH